MSEFKEKIERQLAEEKITEITTKISLYESEIKKLEKLGNTENTFLKILKYCSLCKRGFMVLSALIYAYLFVMIIDFQLSLIVVLGILAVVWFILIYQNIYVKKIDNYLNKSIYKEIQHFEFQLESEKKRREMLVKKEGV